MPTIFRVADTAGKHHYILSFIENNLHHRLTIESEFIVLTTLSNLISLYCVIDKVGLSKITVDSVSSKLIK